MADEGFSFIKPQVGIQPVEAPDMMTPYLQAADNIRKFTGEIHGIAQKIDESALQAERLTLQGIGRDTHTALREKITDPKNFSVNSLQQYQTQAQAANDAILQNASPQNRAWAKAMLSEYTDSTQNVIATQVNELTRNNMLMAGLQGIYGQLDDSRKSAWTGNEQLTAQSMTQLNNTAQNLVANGLWHPASAVSFLHSARQEVQFNYFGGQIDRFFSEQAKAHPDQIEPMRQKFYDGTKGLDPEIHTKVMAEFNRSFQYFKLQNGIDASSINNGIDQQVAKITSGDAKSTDAASLSIRNNAEMLGKGQQVDQAFSRAQWAHDTMDSIKYLSNNESQKIITAYSPKATDSDYIEKLKTIDFVQQANHQRFQAFAQDPMGAVAGSQPVQKAAQNLQVNPNDPESKRQYDDAIISMQDHMGTGLTIGNKLYSSANHSLISHDEATQFIARINQMPNLSDRLQEITALMENHPGREAIVMNDLKKNGINYATPYEIKVNNSPQYRGYLDLVGEASRMKDEKELKLLDDTIKTKTNGGSNIGKLKDLVDVSQQTQDMLSVYGSMQGDSTQQHNEYVNLSTSLAVQLMVKKDMKDGDAVKLAGQILNPETTISSHAGGTYLHPSSIANKQLNQTLEYTKNGLMQGKLPAQFGVIEDATKKIDIKPYMLTNINDKMTREKLSNITIDNSHWANSALFDGVTLYDSNNFPITVNGRDVSLKFKDLETIGSPLNTSVSQHAADNKYRIIEKTIKSTAFKVAAESVLTPGSFKERGAALKELTEELY